MRRFRGWSTVDLATGTQFIFANFHGCREKGSQAYNSNRTARQCQNASGLGTHTVSRPIPAICSGLEDLSLLTVNHFLGVRRHSVLCKGTIVFKVCSYLAQNAKVQLVNKKGY